MTMFLELCLCENIKFFAHVSPVLKENIYSTITRLVFQYGQQFISVMNVENGTDSWNFRVFLTRELFLPDWNWYELSTNEWWDETVFLHSN